MRLYGQSLTLLTDFYQMTMAYGYWKQDMAQREAVFHLFFRKPPFHGGFTIAAGLEAIIDYLKDFKFQSDDIDFLAQLKTDGGSPYFSKDFLKYLSEMQFSCDIDAVPEGTVVFPHEPLLRIQGPIIQCQILETPLLTLFNFPTLIATKAARICLAADGDPVVEFGLRRAQGIDGGVTAARAAYIGGACATSNVLAGKLYGIPVKGTHSHSWVMAFDDEEDAFKAFAETQPDNSIFLVDTYNSIEGVKKAIRTGKWLEEKGNKMIGIRLDSGDLAYLSKLSRKLLDDADLNYAKIFATNELDEVVITELKRQGAKIDIWGVGTNLVTAKDEPALSGVYKLSAIRDSEGKWKYRLKLSEQMQKVSPPGILQVRRFRKENENVADAIFHTHSDNLDDPWKIVDPFDSTRRKQLKSEWEYQDLLVPVFRKGECVYEKPKLENIRKETQRNLSMFHDGVKRFLNPHQYVVGMEQSLYKMKIDLINEVRSWE
jgi:nicotinate phosphoribosyltransferase